MIPKHKFIVSVLILIFIFLLIFLLLRNRNIVNSGPPTQIVPTLHEQWTYVLDTPTGGTGASEGDEIDGVTVDNEGNLFLGGPFSETVDFNGAERTAEIGYDIFLTKLDSAGNELWFRQWDSGGNEFLWDITSDSNGDIIMSGGYGGSLTVSGITYHAWRDGSGFIAKADGDTGELLWLQPFGVKGLSGIIDAEKTAGGNEITVDSQNNIIATVAARGEEYQIGSETYPQSGQKDTFIIKINPNGTIVWTYPFQGGGVKSIRALDVNENDEIVFGHEYIGTFSTREGESMSSGRVRVAQGNAGMLTADGELKWIVPIQSDGFANVRGAGGDAEGNVYFTGEIGENAKIGTQSVKGFKNGSSYLSKYTSDGEPVWTRVLGNKDTDNGGELIVYGNRVAITGTNNGPDYHLYDQDGTLLVRNVHTVPSLRPSVTFRATLTIFDTDGNLVARHSPIHTNSSAGGVLEYAGNNCLVYQMGFYGELEFANGDSYESVHEQDPSIPSKDSVVTKLCL